MLISAETTLAVILGASDFPDCELTPNVAFHHSADSFRRYLLDPDGFGLPRENLLDLFDSPDYTLGQERAIEQFLTRRGAELSASNLAATDFILYYVGHGGFCAPGDQYFLALRCTKTGGEEISGYPIHSLARTINENAATFRRYLILDCCFSAAAYAEFQSDPLTAARRKTEEHFPERGTALLCASGPRNPAKAPVNERFTMFSGALLDVLRNGGSDLPERLSLAQIGKAAEDLIHLRFHDQSVRPEIHFSDQTEGDVATLPMFPNRGCGSRALLREISQLKGAIAGIAKAHDAFAARLSSVAERIDRLELGRKPSPAIGASSAEGSGISEATAEDPADVRTLRIRRFAGLSQRRWGELPPSIKREIYDYHERYRTGAWWLGICLIANIICWSVSFMTTSPYPCLLVPGALFLLQASVLVARYFQLERDVPTHERGASDGIDAVVRARSGPWISILGLNVPEVIFKLTVLVNLLSGLLRLSRLDEPELGDVDHAIARPTGASAWRRSPDACEP